MKFRNFMILVTLFICMMFIPIVEAIAPPDSFTISRSDLHWLYGANYLPASSTIQFTYKKYGSNYIVYCTEIHDNMTETSEKYSKSTISSSEQEKYNRITYILLHGYPNAEISGVSGSDAKYFVTAVAIWGVVKPDDTTVSNFDKNSDGTWKGTYKGKSNAVTQAIAKLVNDSRGYTIPQPTMSASKTSASLSLSSDGKYYVSPQLSVVTTGNVENYSVALSGAPTGTIVTDTNGASKTTFAVGDKFIVKVPVASVTGSAVNFSVNLSSTGKIIQAYKYVPTDSTHQNLTRLYETTISLSASVALSLSLTNEVSISKQDITTSSELSGATLSLTGPNNFSQTWVSTSTPKTFSNLAPGEYTLTETNAPEGYIKSSETIKFTINAAGKLVGGPIVMKNTPKGNVYISKIDATTGDELPGATLVLKNSSGEVVDTWVSGVTPHKVPKVLPAGKYTLTETIAPKGYQKSTETVTFTVKADGTVDGRVVMENQVEPTPDNPKTGVVGMIWVMIGMVAFAISFYYYAEFKLKKNM